MYKREKQNAYQTARLAARRRKWVDKNGPCVKCGSTENLQIDHIDPKKKWKHRIWSYTPEKLELELKKCQVLCQKCHQKKTNLDNGFALIHGTRNGYDHYRCRCEKCREAKTNSMREYRGKLK